MIPTSPPIWFLVAYTLVGLQIAVCTVMMIRGRRVSLPVWLSGPLALTMLGTGAATWRMWQATAEAAADTPNHFDLIATVGLYEAYPLDVYGLLGTTLALVLVASITAMGTAFGNQGRWHLRGAGLLFLGVFTVSAISGMLAIIFEMIPLSGVLGLLLAPAMALATLRISETPAVRDRQNNLRVISLVSAGLSMAFSGLWLWAVGWQLVLSALAKSSHETRELLRGWPWALPNELILVSVGPVMVLALVGLIATRTQVRPSMRRQLLLTGALVGVLLAARVPAVWLSGPLYQVQEDFIGVRESGDFSTPQVPSVTAPTQRHVVVWIRSDELHVHDGPLVPGGSGPSLDAADFQALRERLTRSYEDSPDPTLLVQADRNTQWHLLEDLLRVARFVGYTEVAFVAHDGEVMGVVKRDIGWSPDATPTTPLSALLGSGPRT